MEIKKDAHSELWTALRTQLIDRYTRDFDTSGYGIYVVLWFANGDLTSPSDGTPPTTPAALEDRLRQSLTDDEARKVSVFVLDVSEVP